MDWERAYLDLLEYKERKGLTNLVIRPDTPRRILCDHRASEAIQPGRRRFRVRPESFAGTALLQEAVVNILRKYAENFYRVRRERWDSKHMVYKTLDESDPNLSFNQALVKERKSGRYVVKIQRSEKDLVSAVEKLIGEVERLYKEEQGNCLASISIGTFTSRCSSSMTTR